ncbi:TetR/AcrR family transcriptional regulator [Lederbergia graminis]|uniref:TetR/AcrR family transcriptional regulator n=1 Tax=Lederbergia graminis TaxID=735518 RepID=A0ABW0LK18_9BACI
MDGFERRREQKKLQILEAALSLFIEFGTQKVSIAEIAKRAKVSQVTIYNYYESKDKLIQEVIIYYIHKAWSEYEELFQSDLTFPEKVKRIIFQKSDIANHIHASFFQDFMKEYTEENNFIEEFYAEKALPKFIELFNEGKEQGYIDPSISNEAILFYIQMFKEYMQRPDIANSLLPITEDLTKLFFYGIVGKNEN